MMQESFLPFWKQNILQEQTAFPPSSAFMLESRNDDTSNLETEADPLSVSLLRPSPEPDRNLQTRFQSTMVVVAKAITVGVFLFAATALVANTVLFVGAKVMGGSHKQESLTLFLSLDEDTAKRITSSDHLAQILNIDVDDSGSMAFRWPTEEDNDCPHCGQVDDDDDDSNDPSAVFLSGNAQPGEKLWTLQLHLFQNKDISVPSQQETKSLRSTIRDESKIDSLFFSVGAVNGAFDESEKVLVSQLEDFLCSKIMDSIPEAFKDAAQRICQLQHSEESIVTAEDAATTILGNDRDENGCIGSAGYTWCQSLNACHRPWETSCEPAFVEKSMLGNDRDDHGCDRSAGYSWCETSNSCHRAWESGCGDEEPLLGNDRDDHGCDRSAGYSWCETSSSCHRAWETTCGNHDNDTKNDDAV